VRDKADRGCPVRAGEFNLEKRVRKIETIFLDVLTIRLSVQCVQAFGKFARPTPSRSGELDKMLKLSAEYIVRVQQFASRNPHLGIPVV
jgi:hypothetical protein